MTNNRFEIAINKEIVMPMSLVFILKLKVGNVLFLGGGVGRRGSEIVFASRTQRKFIPSN